MIPALLTVALFTPDLVYPLDYPPQVTSTFGTYRIGHHHAGLDLGTDHDESIRVLAAADGVVFKVRRNHVGYGRAVYVRHPDGRVTVYGHLSAYAPAIAERVREIEARTGAWKIEQGLSPPIPVKQGEPLGWVGTSGTDLVHLHFELRQGATPINPLTNGLVVPDTQPPRIARLLAKPRRATAHVSHGFDEVFFDFRDGGLPEPVVLGGDVGLLVEVNDRIDGSERDLTPHVIELRIDGKRRHLVRYEAVSYADDSHTELDFHPQLRAEGKGVFNKLYREGPRVRVHAQDGPPDLTDLKPGDHEAVITATDAAGNTSEVRFTLRVVPLEPPCEWEAGRPKKAKRASPPAERVWRGSTVAIPVRHLCAGGVARLWAKPGKRGHFALTRLGGAPAVALDLPPGTSSAVQVAVGAGETALEFGLTALGLSEGAVLEDGPVRLEVGKDALFFPYPTEVTEAPNPGGPGLEPVSPLYRLANGWRPTKGRSRIKVKRPPGAGRGVGLYMHERGRWWKVGGGDGEHVTGSIVHLGEFALMRDVHPPELGCPRVEPHPAGWRVEIPMDDPGSDISDFAVKVDGRPVLVEWQRGFRRLVYHPWEPLSPGFHHIEVWAKDRAGRETTRRDTLFYPFTPPPGASERPAARNR